MHPTVQQLLVKKTERTHAQFTSAILHRVGVADQVAIPTPWKPSGVPSVPFDPTITSGPNLRPIPLHRALLILNRLIPACEFDPSVQDKCWPSNEQFVEAAYAEGMLPEEAAELRRVRDWPFHVLATDLSFLYETADPADRVLHAETAVAALFSRDVPPLVHGSADALNFAFRVAAGAGQLNLVQWLATQPDTDVASKDNGAVRWAAENGHLATVKWLEKQPRVDLAADDNAAVRWAANDGHLATVQWLVEQPGVDPAAKDNLAVRWAAGEGHLAWVKW